MNIKVSTGVDYFRSVGIGEESYFGTKTRGTIRTPMESPLT
jgi:hypothetical protein